MSPISNGRLPSLDKTALRRQLLADRLALSPREWKDGSDRLCSHLMTHPAVRSARTVLAYFTFRQEPDLSALWEKHYPHRKTFGFPRCEGDCLRWHSWRKGEALLTGPFGLVEPDPTAPRLAPANVDVILVPCVGCDRQGSRLGYGGGFYDRLLGDPDWRTVPTIGVTFEMGLLAEIPTDSWDQPLHDLCTENGLMKTNCSKD